ncbi:MAG: hypothetical protein K2X44_02005, partial [Magnetospirillum sp.]|nr:hypothetical protein [Magnetospirillum sp.]
RAATGTLRLIFIAPNPFTANPATGGSEAKGMPRINIKILQNFTFCSRSRELLISILGICSHRRHVHPNPAGHNRHGIR